MNGWAFEKKKVLTNSMIKYCGSTTRVFKWENAVLKFFFVNVMQLIN